MILLDGDTVAIDASNLSEYMTCPRAGLYRISRGRVPSATRFSLVAGHAVHAGLEKRARLAGSSPLTEAQIVECETAIRSDYREGLRLEPESPMPELNDWRTPDRCCQLLRSYLKEHPTEPWTPIVVEAGFAHPLGTVKVWWDGDWRDYRVLWMGRKDLLVKWSGERWLVDYKTATRTENNWEQFTLDLGLRGYAWHQRAIGEPVRGVCVQYLIWRPPVQDERKAKPRDEFQRELFPYSDASLDEWAENTLAVCHDMLLCHLRGYWPQFTKQCIGKYGRCPYLDVCSTIPAQREMLLDSALFTDYDWSPLDHNNVDNPPTIQPQVEHDNTTTPPA